MILNQIKKLLLGSLIFLAFSCAASSGAIESNPPEAQSEPQRVVDSDFQRSVLQLAEHENLCPDEGFKLLHGSWDFQGESRLSDFRNRLVFRGQQYTEFLTGGDDEGDEQAIVSGRYACIDGGRLVFHVDRVEPEDGAFGNHANSSYVCTLLWNTQQMGKAMALICHVDWDPAKTIDFVYARSGL